MAATDAIPVPRKNVAFRLYAWVLDADGDPITGGLTGMDTELSADGGAFADATNEFTEIGTSGYGYIDLTAGEMNVDNLGIQIKVTNSGAKNPLITIYPQEDGDIRGNTVMFGGVAGTFSGGRPEVNVTHAAGTAWGSGAITAAAIATDAITAAKVASDVWAEMLTAMFADSRFGLKASGTAQGGTTNGITLAVGSSAVDDFYAGDFILCLIDNVLDGGVIAFYTGANQEALMEIAWRGGVAPDSDDPYWIFAGSPGLTAADIADALVIRHYRGGSDSAPTIADVMAHGAGEVDTGVAGDTLIIYHSDGTTIAIGPKTIARTPLDAIQSVS